MHVALISSRVFLKNRVETLPNNATQVLIGEIYETLSRL